MDKQAGQAIAILAVVAVVAVLVVVIFNPQMVFPAESQSYTYTEAVPVTVDYGGQTISFTVQADRVIGLPEIRAPTVPQFYQMTAADPSQTGTLKRLADGFLDAKNRSGLSDDEFVEVVAKYVQNITYEPGTGLSKSPAETVADHVGDCDDKSLLLAGILAEAGYKVALLYFENESHMAAGVAADPQYDFRNSGYAFIETTVPAYLGDVPLLSGNVSVKSVVPEVIPIGSGEKTYTAMDQNMQILKVREQTKDEMVRLSKLIDAQKERVDLLKGRLPYYSGMQNKNDYQLKYDEYVRAVGLLNEYVKDYNKNVQVYNYILTHTGDRQLVHSYLFPVN
jgi:hypothetical protein